MILISQHQPGLCQMRNLSNAKLSLSFISMVKIYNNDIFRLNNASDASNGQAPPDHLGELTGNFLQCD